jgi:hypothetical protein
VSSRHPDDVLGLGSTWPRPGWAVLDAARDQCFTGCIAFHTTPVVRVHLDRGHIYVAERVSDPSLGARLVDAGALTAAELDQGVIRLGQVEHLGRLFERAPSVDRHRVVVLLEMMTDEAARWVATQIVRGVDVTPYEHHSSGVHRWQTVPDAVAADGRGTALPAPVPGTAHLLVPEPGDVDELGDEVRIEWADAAWLGGGSGDIVERRAVRSLPAGDPEPVATTPLLDDEVAVAFVAAAADEIVDGFEVIWPTGEVQREFPAPVVEREPRVAQVPLTWNIRMPLPTAEPLPTPDPPADLLDELADEVALAVRRAIASITRLDHAAGDDSGALTDEDGARELHDGPLIVRSSTLTDEEASAARRLAEPALDVAPLTPSLVTATNGQAEAPIPLGAPWLPELTPPAAMTPLVEERTSALRRLISGLRRR